MTQKKRVLEYLRNNKSITPMEAWEKLGIYRLGDAIFKLRKDGHDVQSSLIDVKNRFGESCRVAEYRLEK